jgi:Hemerythrin HHE cation binding domain
MVEWIQRPRAGGGVRQAWRRRNERDHTCVAANDTQRAVAFSLQLRRAHQLLRDELARIREALGADEHAADGLQVHCLAFCSALATHHLGEDDGMFRQLLDARPDLAPAIGNLIDDHAAIAAILRQIRALALQWKAAPAESLPELRREFDGLAAIVESHFGYEERALSAALDHGGPDTGWSRPVFEPRL